MNDIRKQVIRQFRAIDYFEVPPQWSHVQSSIDEHGYTSTLCRKDNPDVELSLYCPDKAGPDASPLDRAQLTGMRWVLDQPPHKIQPQEHYFARCLAAQLFDPPTYRAWTESLCNRTALFSQGALPYLPGKIRALILTLDPYRDCTWLEHITYSAPDQAFDKYYNEALSLMRSLPIYIDDFVCEQRDIVLPDDLD